MADVTRKRAQNKELGQPFTTIGTILMNSGLTMDLYGNAQLTTPCYLNSSKEMYLWIETSRGSQFSSDWKDQGRLEEPWSFKFANWHLPSSCAIRDAVLRLSDFLFW